MSREPLSNIELEDKINELRSHIGIGLEVQLKEIADRDSDRWRTFRGLGLLLIPSLFLSVLKLYGLIKTSWLLIWLPLEAMLVFYILIILAFVFCLMTTPRIGGDK